jgi:hypothetical protein
MKKEEFIRQTPSNEIEQSFRDLIDLLILDDDNFISEFESKLNPLRNIYVVPNKFKYLLFELKQSMKDYIFQIEHPKETLYKEDRIRIVKSKYYVKSLIDELNSIYSHLI